MSIARRLEFALSRLADGDWQRFEKLASAFLVDEWGNLRTVAAASGDSGRDAELFSPDGDASVAIQYSIRADWETKILQTAKRLEETFPGKISLLVYATNHQIGPRADELKKTIRTAHRIALDIRDRSWFVDRAESTGGRQKAAEELSTLIVDPLLKDAGGMKSKPQALTGAEAQAAWLYLGMQLEDDSQEKGLTKTCFDALVRAALRGTDTDNRLTRVQVRERVRGMLPGHDATAVDALTDSALNRLAKKAVRHREKEDEFSLSFDERERLKGRLAELETAEEAFEQDLREVTERAAGGCEIEPKNLDPIVARVRRVIERFLLSEGERFANSVANGEFNALKFEELATVFTADLSEHRDGQRLPKLKECVLTAVREVLVSPSETVRGFLRGLADRYTIFAFLRQTPDVQSSLEKMFADGELFLDANIVLPLLAEELFEPSERRFQTLLRAARDSGLDLKVTPGVLQEISGHFKFSRACWRAAAGTWRAELPFLYGIYIASGRSPRGFDVWLEQFAGRETPEADIAEFLEQEYGIAVDNLEEDSAAVDERLRQRVTEIWRVARERQRGEGDTDLAYRLAVHDAESYLGILNRRAKKKRDSAVGYTSWWITVDRTAYEVRDIVRNEFREMALSFPVMSPDFLTNYLAFGPVRRSVGKPVEQRLPVLLEISFPEVPPEFLEVADRIRAAAEGLPERVIQRRVREEFDRQKSRVGAVAQAGTKGMERDLAAKTGQPTKAPSKDISSTN
jgi:hypothetical protein